MGQTRSVSGIKSIKTDNSAVAESSVKGF
jgi:hypothetical protein